MRVLFIKTAPSPYKSKFYNVLSKDIDLTVLYEKGKAIHRHEDWNKRIDIQYKSLFLKYKFGYRNLNITFGLNSVLKQTYDLIVLNEYLSLSSIRILLRKKRICPVILNIDGAVVKRENKIKKLVKKYLINKADFYLSPSSKADEYLKYFSVDKSRIYRYPFTSVSEDYIIDTQKSDYLKVKYKKELGISDNAIISVGQFIHRKGFDTLLKAFSKIKSSASLYIIGGQINKEYSKIINDYHIHNVKFLDFMDEKKLKKHYLASDLFVLATREDIWGLVINEALACGLPVITTNRCIAGTELIEDNRNGMIVPIEDHNKLSEAIDALFGDKERLKIITYNNIELSRRYTIEEMSKSHFNIFSKILEENPSK